MYKLTVGMFPLLLVLMEGVFRYLLGQNLIDFIGPTFCVAGLSFLVPLLRVRTRTIAPSGGAVPGATYDDQGFVYFVTIMLVIFMAAWGVAVSYSLKNPAVAFHGIPIHICIGVALYVISVALTYAKEWK